MKTSKKSRITSGPLVASAFQAIEAEYLRQLSALALELKDGFASGAFGGEVNGEPERSPMARLEVELERRIPRGDAHVIGMICSASPNRWQALDGDWSTTYHAALMAVAVDLCVVAEAHGWTAPAVVATWRTPGKRSPVQPVPVRLTTKAARQRARTPHGRAEGVA